MTEITVFSCPGGCPPGECDTDGPGVEGTNACADCDGAGICWPGELDATPETCPRCHGDGRGSSWGSATCSKCGRSRDSTRPLGGTVKAYLGHNIYVKFDGYAITLIVDNGSRSRAAILLDPDTMLRLDAFRRACGANTKEQSK